ncbi:MAG: hypothetical protein WBP61_08750 [Nocardioides sp.]
MAEVQLVLHQETVEDYVRDAKLALVNATAYVALMASYAAVRIVLDVPYLRAAVGLYLVAALGALVVKLRVLHERVRWLIGAALVGLAVNLVLLLALVEVNRGTLFAEAGAALVAFATVHLLDRAALARA